ncbi:MAG: molybdopterin-dependent oxidoreductase [Spirochaetia bacterium]|nr:molybdopterin-dependent oxidoreductase [Spirochaetia bacterium]
MKKEFKKDTEINNSFADKLDNLIQTKIDRKNFLKKIGTAYAVALAGPLIFNSCKESDEETFLDKLSIKWEKAPCRFCGVGCSAMVGVRDGKIVAIAGDRKSSVNKGLLCIKGYHLGEILYGEDRFHNALIRKNGKLVESPLEEALTLVASRFKESIAANGADSVAIYGSGQWTIQDGYSALKLMKGGIGTNNIEANARLCMASAVTGFMTTFGKDEPMGCYDDLDIGDVFVFWGNNMAETHPVLFSRIMENKRINPKVQLVDITVRQTRTSDSSDMVLYFNPQSDLAIANAIAREIVYNNRYNHSFVENHTFFKSGTTNIGFGLEGVAEPAITDKKNSFEQYKKSLDMYTLEYVQKISGVSAEKIQKLASYYADPNIKIVSLWCMGMNQHTRGTWINNLVYNIHLLTGKISQPGNGPFSLTGQPSACGTVREVGTLTHGLPAGRNVKNPEDRAFTENLWGIKSGTIPAKPSAHTIAMFRKLKDGKIKAIMIQTTNPMVTLPDRDKFLKGIQKNKPFIVVCDVYPTPTTEIADVVLPAAMWVERAGCFGNSERRTQQWNKMVEAPGDSHPDSWYNIEIGRRLGFGNLFPWKTEEEQAEGLYEEYRKFTIGVGKDIAPYKRLQKERGMRWPVVNGKETLWRYREGSDPYVHKGEGFSFYGNKILGNRAVIWERPYEAPPEVPDSEYPFWLCTGRVIEHWHTGSMTRRVEQIHKAMPHAYVELNKDDAKNLKIKNGDDVKLTSRRGSLVLPAMIDGRAKPKKGLVFVPFFDESLLINKLTLDAHCPISKQPDYKKCSVKVERG